MEIFDDPIKVILKKLVFYMLDLFDFLLTRRLDFSQRVATHHLIAFYDA